MLDSELFVNNNNHIYDSPSLKTIQRKISKQKIAAERRLEHTNGDYNHSSMHNHHHSSYEQRQSPFTQTSSFNFDNALKRSTNSRGLHGDDDAILTNSFEPQQQFHQPNTRKVTKIIPKENHSISNSRPIQPRSASASAASTTKRETRDSSLRANDVQRLKQVRRHEPAHVQVGSKSGLITPHSWKTDPVVLKKPPPTKKSTKEKQPKTNSVSRPVVERLTTDTKPKPEKQSKPKRDTSATKPSKTETEPTKTPAKKLERSEEEKEKIKKYMQEKREQYEKQLLNEKKVKSKEENERKDKLKQLNQQIKVVAQQPLPPSLVKRPLTAIQPHDLSEQRRERLLSLLGPKPGIELPREDYNSMPFERVSVPERSISPSSSSSSSSSSESVIEIQPPRSNGRSRFELSVPHDDIKHRHQNILRWANNLARDCDTIENKFKYLRPDGTQTFDIIPATHQQLKYDDGNLRTQPPVVINNNNNTEPEITLPSKLVRPSGHLSSLNQNYVTEYQGKKLPGVGNLRDPLLAQRIKCDQAATKIQAVYRGYNVRKSLQWTDQNQQLKSESNKRSNYKPTKKSSYTNNLYENSGIDVDIRFPDDKFTIGSTLLRLCLRDENSTVPTKHSIRSEKSEQESKKLEKPTSLHTYSDDYENTVSSTSSVSNHRQRTLEKPRVIQQPLPKKPSLSSSKSSSSSSSSSGGTTPTPEPYVPTNVQRRRSMSPPIPPPMSPDNGRPIHQQYHHPPPPPAVHRASPVTNPKRVRDERRYSPDALERQLNAELHLLDGVEASMKQIDNMERLRSVALAQQEVVSLAQIIRNRPTTDDLPQQKQVRKSSPRPSSSSSSDRSHRISSPRPVPTKSKHTHHRHSQSSSASSTTPSESVLTERQKDMGKKFRDEKELQAYEKRLVDLEKKIRRLFKHVPAIFDDKKKTSTMRSSPKSSNESSISEDIPVTHPSSSTTSNTVRRKTNNDSSEIRTETLSKNESDDSISTNNYQTQSVTTTTDFSNIERRINNIREELDRKKAEYEKLKQQKAKENLKREEDKLKEELQNYERQIETLRREPVLPKREPESISPKRESERKEPITLHRSPIKSISSSSTSSSTPTVTKPQESSIVEEIPTASITQPKTDLVDKRIEPSRPIRNKIRDFFDDDEEEEEEKRPDLKPLETPRDERDTQHDALSLSIATDINALSETENNHSRGTSSDNERPILNLNTKLPSPRKSRDESESSTSSTTPAPNERTSSQQRPPSRSSERRPSSIANDYDEDFSEVSRSPDNTSKSSAKSRPKIDNIDIESIQEDIDNKHSSHDTNQSSTSKSSDDEQSEILVLVKKSANSTPRRQDERTPNDDDFFAVQPSLPPSIPRETIQQPKTESVNNDDTSHDISDDDEANERIEQEHKVDKLTDILLKTFIDEAIGQGKHIKRLKKERPKRFASVTLAAKEWMSDEDMTDDESPAPTNVIPIEFDHYKERKLRQSDITPTDYNILDDKISQQVDVVTIDIDQIDEKPPTQVDVVPSDFNLDLSRLDEKSADEPRIESPRRIVIEEQVKFYIPHTTEQVTTLCHDALKILFDQNTDFSNRTAIQCRIPNSFYEFEQQESDNEILRRNRHAYCQMIFDLCAELLYEMHSDTIQTVKHPEWQTAKLLPKRFYRGNKPKDRNSIEQFIQKTILEILNLNRRQITYTKWRVDKLPNSSKEKFETVLDEEIRRNESQWINYNEDAIQLRFEIADSIFNQLVHETIIECLDVVDRRFYFRSNSTRL